MIRPWAVADQIADQLAFAPQHAAVGVGIGPHATVPLGRKGADLVLDRPVAVKQLPGPVALQPVLENLQVGWVGLHVPHRNLMGAPEILQLFAVDLRWARPPFW